MSAPQHSATAPIRFISWQAFDNARIGAERKLMPDSGNDHPAVVYFSGRSRYDLDAPYLVGEESRCARDYLKADHVCPTWTAKRLGAIVTARLQDQGGHVAELEAVSRAFESVDQDVPGFRPVPDRQLTEAQIDQLVERFGLEALYEFGEAILRASAAPMPAEGKR